MLAPDALDRLPAGPPGADPYWRLAAAFPIGYPDATARAYLGDLTAWATWCADRGIHPLTARRHHVDTWVRHLGLDPSRPPAGRPPRPPSPGDSPA